MPIVHNIRLFMAIEIQHFLVLGETEPFMMKPVTSHAEADTLGSPHVDLRESSSSRYCFSPTGISLFTRFAPYASTAFSVIVVFSGYF